MMMSRESGVTGVHRPHTLEHHKRRFARLIGSLMVPFFEGSMHPKPRVLKSGSFGELDKYDGKPRIFFHPQFAAQHQKDAVDSC
jgi:hypothetical protein